ncbi:MAG: cytochrome P460 family protein [Paracoccaceae bacterium]
MPNLRSIPSALMITLALWGTGETVHAQSESDSAHITLENPADLSKDDARQIYDQIKDRMARGYAGAGMGVLADYQDWPLLNDAPYISATHGQRYVNNFANSTAEGYATLEEGAFLPEGSVLVKDSLTVTDEGRVFPAAVFVMEKLSSGTSPETGDWRYVMVMPDGSIFGDTQGTRAGKVAYCHDCHAQVPERDFTFGVPEDYLIAE